MTLQELITDLKAAGCNDNTLRLAMNCYELGQADKCRELAEQIEKMPFGDTGQSFAVWVRSQA